MQKAGTFAQYIYDQELAPIMTWREYIYTFKAQAALLTHALNLKHILLSEFSHNQILEDEFTLNFRHHLLHNFRCCLNR